MLPSKVDQPPQRCSGTAPATSRLWLLAACAAIALLWLVVLPAVGQQKSVRRHIDRNRARGIHPDAMFYTEVGAIDGVRLAYEKGRPVGKSIRMGE